MGGEEGCRGSEDTATATSIDELGSEIQPTETWGILYEERIGADRLSICEGGEEGGADRRGSTATRQTEPEARVSGPREAALGATAGRWSTWPESVTTSEYQCPHSVWIVHSHSSCMFELKTLSSVTRCGET